MSTTTSIKIRRAGASLIATIPKHVADHEHLRAGERVLVTFRRPEEAWEELAALTKDIGPVKRSEYRGVDRY
ncbi:MAG TPA: hypothetical protein VGB18_03140, partial [Candidatus Thermoplasmatota archaeon]